MKPSNLAFLLITLISFSSKAQSQMDIGEVTIAGSGCRSDLPADRQLIEISDNKLRIDLPLQVKKGSSQSIARQSCSLAAAITASQNQRIILQNTSAHGVVSLDRGLKSSLSLEIFKAGTRNKPLVAKVKSSGSAPKMISLQQNTTALTLECGEAAILRVNSSAIIQGSGKGQAELNLAELELKTEDCTK